jgi:hypothetical protein
VYFVSRHSGLTAMVASGGLSFGLAALAFGVLRPNERRMALDLLTRAGGRLRAGRPRAN